MLIRSGKLRSRTAKGGGGGPALAYSPVVFLMGDSQSLANLSAADQAAAVAAYGVTDKIKILNASNQFVTYTPGTIAGLHFGGNVGNVGQEIGIIQKFRATYPNDTLYIVKDSFSGSHQTRGIGVGTANVTSTGNANITVNSGTLNNGDLIVGLGIETGVYLPFGGFLSKVGLAGGRTGAAFGPVSATRYAGNASWSNAEGLCYNGYGGAINNGVRARLVAALPLLTNPRIVAVQYNLGTNDALNNVAATYATELDAFVARLGSDVDLSHAVWNLVRWANAGAGASAVRTALANKASANPSKFKIIDTDGYTRWDTTHWDLAGQTAIGVAGFANITF
ncbi:MAG: hypothetical protein ABW006_13745 [Hyphomicrobium sp.]